MNLYLDTCALIKRYRSEWGTSEVNDLIDSADLTATAKITRVEIAAALNKLVRTGDLTSAMAAEGFGYFENDWPALAQLGLTHELIESAQQLTWQHPLKAYDAVHLAAAARLQELLGAPVTLATFDRALWTAAQAEGFVCWPADPDQYRAA